MPRTPQPLRARAADRTSPNTFHSRGIDSARTWRGTPAAESGRQIPPAEAAKGYPADSEEWVLIRGVSHAAGFGTVKAREKPENSRCTARPTVSEPQPSAICCVRFCTPTPRPGNKPADGRRNRQQKATGSVRKGTTQLTAPPPEVYSQSAVGIEKPISSFAVFLTTSTIMPWVGGTIRKCKRCTPAENC
jgi:hypothetical protein